LPGFYVFILLVIVFFSVVIVIVDVVIVLVFDVIVVKNVIDAANVDRCHDAGSVAGFAFSRFGGG